MTGLLEIISHLEEAGGKLTLDGERIRYRIPAGDAEASSLLAELRKRKSDVVELLRARNSTPAMPPGVRLIEWRLKEPPVCLEVYSIVTDCRKFAESTLGQIDKLRKNPKAKVGWTMAQLIDRLAQVGVKIALESANAFIAKSDAKYGDQENE